MGVLFDNRMAHFGYVGTDLDKMVDRMVQSGIGPWFYIRDLQIESRFRGERRDLNISLAFGATAGHLMELLVQNNDVPSAYREFLSRHPDGGLHHVCYMADDLDAKVEDLKREGEKYTLVQEFMATNGKPNEIYLEPQGSEDPLLMQILLPTPWDHAFQTIRELGLDWDRTEPKREMSDIIPDDIKRALAAGYAI